MRALGETSIRLDCDVLQADGGTRTASICGAYVALHDACERLVQAGHIPANPLTTECVAISVGIVDGHPVLDLPYPEDSTADVDFNVIMDGNGQLIEVQGTAEGNTFSQPNSTPCSTSPRVASPPSPRRNAPCSPTLLRLVPRTLMADLPRLVCASANPDKVAEIALVLDGLVDLQPRPAGLGDVVEDAPDLEGNARLKAVAVCEAAGAPAVSDDTGLEVDALDGAPGVFSARYAGDDVSYQDNVDKLMAELGGSGADPRAAHARFRTAVMVVWPDGRALSVEGAVEGHIALVPAGDGGFGYDPVFVPAEGDGRTFAEMGDDKHEISHRGRAFRALAEALRAEG